MEEINGEDIPKIMEYIQGCLTAYSIWKQKFKTRLEKPISPQELIHIQHNYCAVMDALTTCLKFIKQCRHVLESYRHALIFGVIYAGMQDVKTENQELIKEINDYKVWYIDQFKEMTLLN